MALIEITPKVRRRGTTQERVENLRHGPNVRERTTSTNVCYLIDILSCFVNLIQ